MNRVVLIGRLTKDVEVKATMGGQTYTRFTLAVNRGKEVTDFISCTAWEKTAELLKTYTHKGSQIGVEGRLQSNSWEDMNGKKNYGMDVRVDSITLLDKKEQKEEPERETRVPVPQTLEITADDLPF